MILNEMSVEALKALAYDQLSTIEASQRNLAVINKELQSRQNSPEIKKEE